MTTPLYASNSISDSGLNGKTWTWILPALWTILLFSVSQLAYTWFHSLAELFTVIVGISLYLIAMQTFSFTRNRYLLVVANGFFWSSIIDIFHTLTYEGMGNASHYPPDTPPLLWMCARSIQLTAFLIAPYAARRAWSNRYLFTVFGLTTIALVLSVFNGFMPTAWIAGKGLTPFKITWEWLLMGGYCVAALLLSRQSATLNPTVRHSLTIVMGLGIATELCFTWYVAMYGLSNMVGHILKLWAYWAMFLVISQHMLTRPKALLKEQAQFLEKVVTQVPGMTYVIERTPNGRYAIPFVSPSIASLLELTPDSVVQDASPLFERIAPEHRDRITRLIENCYTNQIAWNTIWEVELPQQGRLWHQGSSSAPIVRPDGSCAWVAYAQDITEQKKMELELIRHRDELTTLVDERTEELRQAMQSAQNAARTKTEFLANMSHEIRTPLNAIIGLAQVGLRTQQVEVAWPYLAQIQDSGRLLMSLINDVLDIAKVDAGKLSLEVRAVNLYAILERAFKLMLPHAQEKNLILQLEYDDSQPLPAAIMGDETRLLQVLMNLLSNAIKFTERGSVHIRAVATLTGDTGHLVLSVRDTGAGIASDQIERLFNPFEQASPSTTRLYGGTGLGLTICRQIVNLMEGHIDVSSQLGVGSCFSVHLPIQVTNPVLAHTHQPIPITDSLQCRLNGIRILAAEDDLVNQWVLRELLALEGAECTLRSSGYEALSDIQSEKVIDVFITDIQMPQLNGYDTAIQARKLRPHLPIIGLTAFAMTEDRQKCLDAGMFAHISKPVDIDTLVRVIQEALQQSVVDIPEAPNEDFTAAPQNIPPLIDWALLKERLHKTESRIQFLQTFLDNYSAAPATLRTLVQAGEVDSVQRLVHKIQGAVGFLCATAVQQRAKNIETHLLHTHELQQDLAAALADDLEKVVQEITEHLKLITPAPPP